VRLVDVVFRRGHLSDRALTDICLTGDRPLHLDQCEICAERADALGRWLDDVRAVAVEEADAAFPAERLAAQQGQILRRLEQIDRPVRVIAFPGQSRERGERVVRGIRPAWVGFAAAAGLVLGLLGGQVTSRLTARHEVARPPIQATQVAAQPVSYEFADLDLDLQDRPLLEYFAGLDAYTPHAVSPGDLAIRTSQRGR
jgi:hypothetical protein